ncbi:hypothetical protein Pla8534_18020 [Lignipirellula cremea]|uniref:Uncharacterized protein n=1 Tax=Lignipirellula cremea TaxID=2528010 RepID=A0A518DQA8_9BACT|nr:hypothetical protein Pla8534_18020 [Lignipirellula cremea]
MFAALPTGGFAIPRSDRHGGMARRKRSDKGVTNDYD